MARRPRRNHARPSKRRSPSRRSATKAPSPNWRTAPKRRRDNRSTKGHGCRTCSVLNDFSAEATSRERGSQNRVRHIPSTDNSDASQIH